MCKLLPYDSIYAFLREVLISTGVDAPCAACMVAEISEYTILSACIMLGLFLLYIIARCVFRKKGKTLVKWGLGLPGILALLTFLILLGTDTVTPQRMGTAIRSLSEYSFATLPVAAVVVVVTALSIFRVWFFSVVAAAWRALCRFMAYIRNALSLKPLLTTPIKANPGKWAWIAVAVLWVVVMLNYFDRQLLSVLNEPITEGKDKIDMTQAQFGAVTSAFLIVYAALSPVGGYLADRFSRKFIILCSLVVWSVVTWMTGRADSYGELLFWRGAMGVSEAFYIPAALALISDYHRGSTRSMATGLHMSGIYVGQMLAGCGAWIAENEACAIGWRLTFETFGFIGVAYAFIVIIFLRDPMPASASSAETEACMSAGEEAMSAAEKAPAAVAAEEKPGFLSIMKKLFTGRAMAMLLVMYACAGFANWFLMGWYPRLLQDSFQLTADKAGPMATFWINVTKFAAVLLAAVVADMWYRKNRNARAYVPGICFCLAGPCVIVAMLPAIGLPLSLGLAATVALVSMQGVAQGSLDATLMPVLRSHIDERYSATGYGLLNLTSVSAGALISWLGGFLKDSGVPLGVPLCIAGVLMVICGLFFFFLPKQSA